MTAEISIGSDRLERSKFLNALEENIRTLADVPSEFLATPRAISVDAKWGNGKTWVAKALVARAQGQGAHVVYIDAFRHDHHDDAYAVIASAVFDVLRPKGEQKRKFLSAAGAVLKNTASVAAKAAISAGAGMIGVANGSEAIAKILQDGVEKGVEGFSEEAVESLFRKYSKTEEVQRQFMNSLSEITSGLQAPLVVVVDELDRCRPSFALEVLERIKHIFDAENTVFVLFWNSTSIHESIRHTYGAKTDAEQYLSKFIAFNVPLELPVLSKRVKRRSIRFQGFIAAIVKDVFPAEGDHFGFIQAMAEGCEALDPSLRQIQIALQIANRIHAYKKEWFEVTTYLCLLKAIDDGRFSRVCRLEDLQCGIEANQFTDRLGVDLAKGVELHTVHALCEYVSRSKRYSALETGTERPTIHEQAVLEIVDSGRAVSYFRDFAADMFQGLISKEHSGALANRKPASTSGA